MEHPADARGDGNHRPHRLTELADLLDRPARERSDRPDLVALARQLEAYDQWGQLTEARWAATVEASAARARLTQLDVAAERAMLAQITFHRALGAVYREPEAARQAYAEAAASVGADGAARLMRMRPALFGELAIERHPVVFGLFHRDDDRHARAAAPLAAAWGRAATDALRDLEAVRVALHESRLESVHRAVHRFETALAEVYQNPVDARRRFEQLVTDRGVDQAATVLRSRPELLGVLRVGPERVGPEAWARAASVGIEAARTAHELPAAERRIVGDMARVPSIVTERAAVAAAVDRATQRERTLAGQLAGLPWAEAIERGVAQFARRLTPEEFQQLTALLTAPQLALAQRLRQSMRDVALGSDGRER